jgi:hypothetical protein
LILVHYCDSRNRIETIIDSVVEDVISNIERLGGSATYLRELHLLTINTKLTISIGVATCVSDGAARAPRWQLRRLKYERADLSLVIRMDQSNTGVLSYYLLPTGHLPPKQNYRLRFSQRVFSEAYRHDSLKCALPHVDPRYCATKAKIAFEEFELNVRESEFLPNRGAKLPKC